MRKHNGMRPQDVAILIKIASLPEINWTLLDLAASLHVSLSEISESLNRSRAAGLIDHTKKQVFSQNLLEFLQYGFKYVFPQMPGTIVRGVPAAHSHPYMKKFIKSEVNYVWADSEGKTMGLLIEPLYSKQTKAIHSSPEFYEMLALADVLRIGKIREKEIAVRQLKKLLEKNEQQSKLRTN
jgi:hypothetical protein